MSEITTYGTSSVFRRTVTSRDKLIISAALVLVALLAGFVHWFVTSPEPTQLKWAIVGSSAGFIASGIFISMVVPSLLVHHFMIEAGRMKVMTWCLLLLVYIAMGFLSVVGFSYFFDLAGYYSAQIDVLSVCQDNGVSADECAGIAANLAIEKDR